MSLGDYNASTLVESAAIRAASSNPIWGAAPAVSVELCDDGFISPSCPVLDRLPTPSARTWFAATVRVNREDLNNPGQPGGTESACVGGNALPTYFAKLFGVDCQEVRAQATAVAAPANTVRCVWPVAIPDVWRPDNSPPNEPVFAKYAYPPGDQITLVAEPDVYVPPPTAVAGSTSDDDAGFPAPTGLVIQDETLSPSVTSWRLNGLRTAPWPEIDQTDGVAVVIPRSDGAGFEANLASCNLRPIHLGDVLQVDGGGTFEQMTTAASARLDEDAGADWNTSRLRVRGSCATENPPCAAISPRLVALPVFDPDEYDKTRGSGTPTIKIVNFVGFFIDKVNNNKIEGYLTTYPGGIEYGSEASPYPFIAYKYSLLRTVVLTR
jgi:hypothetical protein